jgi:hypothetical protein
MSNKKKLIVLASSAFVVLFLTYPIWRILLPEHFVQAHVPAPSKSPGLIVVPSPR